MLDIDEHAELWEPPAELIDRDRLPGMPRQGIGRGFKVSKEQIVALLVALRMFVRGDYDERAGRLPSRLQPIAEVAGRRGRSMHACWKRRRSACRCWRSPSTKRSSGRTAVEVCGRLRAGSPPCYVGHWSLDEGKLMINPLHLDDERAAELARRLARGVDAMKNPISSYHPPREGESPAGPAAQRGMFRFDRCTTCLPHFQSCSSRFPQPRPTTSLASRRSKTSWCACATACGWRPTFTCRRERASRSRAIGRRS